VKEITIVIFAKAPRAGEVKTRLIPALGPEGAAMLAQRLLSHAIEQAIAADVGRVELCLTPDDEHVWAEFAVPSIVAQSPQGAGDLGERLARASKRVIDAGSAVLLIGTDCPALDARMLRLLASSLENADAAMAPAVDGGYVALALKRYHPRLFERIDWSTSTVAAETLRRLEELGWPTRQLPAMHDIDEPQDLQWLPAEWPEARFSLENRSSFETAAKNRKH
jgi:rSAM/selenodomain-associated transferase 1